MNTPRRPVRVAFVVHVMQVAGAEVLVRETIRRLGPRIVPTVFCLDRVGQIGEELVADGIDLVCFDRKPGRDYGVSRRLAAAASARRIDVIHAHQYTPFFYSALAKPLCRHRPKLILTEHGRHFPDHVSPHRRAFNRLVLDRLADAINACCRFSGRALFAVDGFRGNRIEVIENGIQVDRYGPVADKAALKRTLGLDPGRRGIVHVARHHPVKDQPTLIRGFATAAADLPDVDLVLVGDGPLRQDLEDLARSLGVAGRVKFVGIRSNVPDWLAAADAFALTSVSEAASLTLLEAMATGLPVVVTAVGGNPEIVRDGVDGLHVPRGDVAALSAAFRRLFTDPALAARLGASGRARARDRYRLDRTVDAYYTLYRRLTGL
jgi:glycosyltransferase involved in cell wall biosynthesis